MKGDYLFVYGTLKRGSQNAMQRFLLRHADYIGEASYCGKLYQIDGYPGTVPSDHPRDQIQGEVYWLPEPELVWQMLDRYEECGPDFPEPWEYIRRKQNVLLNNCTNVSVWIYLYNHSTFGLQSINPAKHAANW
jgi:gamma-glutamylcyclotransferase (GGCT)/AIG2-like uncharacterized protein YtfP